MNRIISSFTNLCYWLKTFHVGTGNQSESSSIPNPNWFLSRDEQLLIPARKAMSNSIMVS